MEGTKLKHAGKFAVNKEVYIIMLLYERRVNFTLYPAMKAH
jgi:hypothetical protein